MHDEIVPEERGGVNGAENGVEDGVEIRAEENAAAAGEMVVERVQEDGAELVEVAVQGNVREDLGPGPPAVLAEIVIVDGGVDESAPTTPDYPAERVDFIASALKKFECKGSGSEQSVAKRMRTESPIRELCDRKEERIAAAWEHWRRLGSPKLHVAPMVDQSELPFRMLCRKYGATAAYTPMLHSRLYVQDHKYRKEFTTCPEDRPLFVQFCANNPETLLEAGRLVESQCDYVDINLGCPQRIAKRGNYGAFLMDNLPLIQSLVSNLSSNLTTPVSCKIRLFPDIKDTLSYAHMLEDAGCSLLAVHGRTRDQKNGKLVRADWEAIKTVRETLKIPVLANGNIRWLEDVESCIAATGVEGVMSAESLLENPALFAGFRTTDEEDNDVEAHGDQEHPKTVDARELCLEYLDLCETHPVPMRMVRGHVHKMLGKFWFKQHPDLREELNKQYKLTLGWLKDMLERMMARPLPEKKRCSSSSSSLIDKCEETGCAAPNHSVEILAVKASDSGAVSAETPPASVALQETVTVQ